MRARLSRVIASGLILGAGLAPMTAWGEDELNDRTGLDTPASGRGNYSRLLPPPRFSATGGAVVQGNGIIYHNGPVMHSGVNIYYIWYGNWAQDATANAILTNYAMYVGGSPYFNINTTYGDSTGNVPNTPSTVKYVASTADTGSLGTSLSDGNIWTLVYNALHSGALPVDPNGVYFVLTAPHVAETSGFLTKYCGWHTYNYYGNNNTPIKYAFVGNPAANLGACAAQSTSPNGDAAADGMASVIAHELEEAATDPQLNAWYDSNGQEVADKCAWTFGTLFSANGAWANMELGTRYYLIQRNWVNASGGYCALSYGVTPSFSIAVSPGSQAVMAGQTTGNYTMTATALNGWTGTVRYSVAGGLPSGATAHVNGNLITIGTTTGTPAGSFTLTISGTDGVTTHTTTATLGVTAVVTGFSVSISPATKSVTRAKSGNVSMAFTVTVTPTGGYNGTVNLTVAGAASGLTLVLNPGTIRGGSGMATLMATVSASAAKGARTLTVTAKDTKTTKTATATLTIN